MTVSNFPIAAVGNDGGTISATPQAVYANAAFDSASVTNTNDAALRTLSGGDFYIRYAHFRWDTSSIPDADTVSAATLRMYLDTKQDTDNRNLQGDWHDFDVPTVGLGSEDWVHDAPTANAFAEDITGLTDGANNTITLSNVAANISKTGFTGIRVGVSGGEPTGTNRFDIAMLEHATSDEAMLSVTHLPTFTPVTIRVVAQAAQRAATR